MHPVHVSRELGNRLQPLAEGTHDPRRTDSLPFAVLEMAVFHPILALGTKYARVFVCAETFGGVEGLFTVVALVL